MAPELLHNALTVSETADSSPDGQCTTSFRGNRTGKVLRIRFVQPDCRCAFSIFAFIDQVGQRVGFKYLVHWTFSLFQHGESFQLSNSQSVVFFFFFLLVCVLFRLWARRCGDDEEVEQMEVKSARSLPSVLIVTNDVNVKSVW